MEQNLTVMLLQSVAALAVVLALFAALVWAMKRFQNYTIHTSDTLSMRVVQRISLDSRHSLVEVQRGHKHYVLSLSTAAGVRMIESFEQQDDDTHADSVASNDVPHD